MKIIVEETDWGDASTEDIRALLEDVVSQLLRHFHEPFAGRIIVQYRPQAGGPRVLYRASTEEDYVVWLTTKNRLWSQFTYQFSHELCHILSGFERLRDSTNQWFHEVLCEMASLFVLKQMSENWRSKPPYPNWADYSSSLGKYADDIIGKDEHQLLDGADIRNWILANEASLRSDPYQRTLNSWLAVQLLPLFQGEPTHWNCIRHLPSSSSAISEYLVEWEVLCPGPHKQFISRLRSKLGPSPS